ncbi:MAG: hypothetical protein ACPG8W_06765 [Candidatus Promineifilaceae bacterium]
MKITLRQFVIGALLLLALVVLIMQLVLADSSNITTVTVEDSVWLPDAKRLGVNLGKPDQYGAAQYLKNVISNPGFESGEFASIVFAEEGATATTFQQDNWKVAWNTARVGQPVDFWRGATYEVLTGQSRGTKGIIGGFKHVDNAYTFSLGSQGGSSDLAEGQSDLIALAEDDAIMLRRSIPGFDADNRPFNQADTSQIRPGSPGEQSLKLSSAEPNWKPSFEYYMDSFWRDGDTTAGKLIYVEGNWHFEVWAKGSSNQDVLEVVFRREGELPFMEQAFPLTTGWQKVEHDFFVPQNFDPREWTNHTVSNPLLLLTMRIPQGSDGVWIDDMALERRDYTNPTVFSDKLVAALHELNPGILRNWGNQLGSSLENQLAEPWARKPTGYSPRDRIAVQYDYSLHEFLELSREIDAEPWYVIPPTWTEQEVRDLMAYLAAPAGANAWADKRVALGQAAPWTDVFPTIHLEFGNELWGANAGGDPFLGATLRGGGRVGLVGGERIGIMKASPYYNSAEFNFIIGGQFHHPRSQADIEANSNTHDMVALAPYFGELENFATDKRIFYPLFARPYQDVQSGTLAQSQNILKNAGNDTGLAVYEINFHNTTGDAPLSIRNGFMTGLNGGVALPLYMLSYQKWLGIRDQAAFTALQYSFRMENGEYARVWGMLRDLEATGWRRPTWLGVELANKAVRGEMVATTHTGDDPRWTQDPINGIVEPIEVPFVQSFAFRERDSYSVVLFNLNIDEAQTIILQTPRTPDSQALLHRLYSENIHHNNESAPVINIRTVPLADFSKSYELILPPHSVTVVEWGIDGFPPPIPAEEATPFPKPLPSSTPEPTPVGQEPEPEPTPAPTSTPIIASTITTQTVIITNEISVVLPSEPIPSVIGANNPANFSDVNWTQPNSVISGARNDTRVLGLLVLIVLFNVIVVVAGATYLIRRRGR